MKWTAADLTLEQKVGQMFICGFNALTPNEHANILIEQFQWGHLLLPPEREDAASACRAVGIPAAARFGKPTVSASDLD